MSKFIISEDHAERIGARITKGKRGKDFLVFWYKHKRSQLTLFSIKIIATGQHINHA